MVASSVQADTMQLPHIAGASAPSAAAAATDSSIITTFSSATPDPLPSVPLPPAAPPARPAALHVLGPARVTPPYGVSSDAAASAAARLRLLSARRRALRSALSRQDPQQTGCVTADGLAAALEEAGSLANAREVAKACAACAPPPPPPPPNGSSGRRRGRRRRAADADADATRRRRVGIDAFLSSTACEELTRRRAGRSGTLRGDPLVWTGDEEQRRLLLLSQQQRQQQQQRARGGGGGGGARPKQPCPTKSSRLRCTEARRTAELLKVLPPVPFAATRFTPAPPPHLGRSRLARCLAHTVGSSMLGKLDACVEEGAEEGS